MTEPQPITLDDLVTEIRDSASSVVLLVGTAHLVRDLLDEIAGRVRVRQRWYTNGCWRLETESLTTVRHVSLNRDALRGRAADLVVLVGDVPEQLRLDAELVVASKPAGRVAVL